MGCYSYPMQSAVQIPAPIVVVKKPKRAPVVEKPTYGGCKKHKAQKELFWEMFFNRVSQRRYFPFVDTMEVRPSDLLNFPMPAMMPF